MPAGGATCGLRPSGDPLSRRIEGDVAESATAHHTHYRDNGRSQAEAVRATRKAKAGQFATINKAEGLPHHRRTPNQGQNPAKNRGSPTFPGTEMHLQSAAKTGASTGTTFAWNRIEPAATSNQFRAISKRRARQTHAENYRPRPGFASSAPYPSVLVRLPALKTPEPKIAPQTPVTGYGPRREMRSKRQRI